MSPTTEDLVGRLFSASDIDEARQLLEEECAENLPLIHSPDPVGLERIRFAALRASEGDLAKLLKMVLLAQVDWRDLLVVAGFGYSTQAHAEWARSLLGAA
ncbi:MAG: hypothetical protein P8X82_10820 [Gemmatimonadales bacterium]